jgi:hypothetical protein
MDVGCGGFRFLNLDLETDAILAVHVYIHSGRVMNSLLHCIRSTPYSAAVRNASIYGRRSTSACRSQEELR